MIFEPFIIKKGSDFSVPLKVYADEGALITARLGDIEVTAISSADGVATLTLPSAGDWIVTAELDGTVLQPETITLPYYYEASFSFKGPRLPDGYIETQYISNPNLLDTLGWDKVGGTPPFNETRIEFYADFSPLVTTTLTADTQFGLFGTSTYYYSKDYNGNITSHATDQNIRIFYSNSTKAYTVRLISDYLTSGLGTGICAEVDINLNSGKIPVIIDVPKTFLKVGNNEVNTFSKTPVPDKAHYSTRGLFYIYQYYYYYDSKSNTQINKAYRLFPCNYNLYEIKVYNSTAEATGELTQDWIPYRKEDGEVGMFDIVRGEDYRIYSAYNASTKLVAGPDA